MKQTILTRPLVAFLLDETGSMNMIKEETIRAFNSYKSDLGRCNFTFATFNSRKFDLRFRNTPIENVYDLNWENYRPDNTTPLIDAAISLISELGPPPSVRVTVVIQTDGEENSSRRTIGELRRLISDKRELGWQFVLLGVNVSTYMYEFGANIGVPRESIISVRTENFERTMSDLGRRTTHYFMGESENVSYSDAEKRELGDDNF